VPAATHTPKPVLSTAPLRTGAVSQTIPPTTAGQPAVKVAAPPTTAAAPTAAHPLAFTGFNLVLPLIVAGFLFAAGAALVLGSRRRQSANR